MESANKSWLAAYLYYAEPWERLLVDAIKPFVDSTLASGLAEQFFFIRYWERGPHVRLRFKGNITTLKNKLKPKLDAHFLNYFSANPSQRVEPGWIKELPAAQSWFTNNSIQYISYEPEMERYGGLHGILTAEKQFQASSEAVLAILAKSQNWSYERALGAAIQLHLAFVHAIGMNLEEVTAFYTALFENWFGWGLGLYDYEKKQPVENSTDRRKEVIDSFEKQFHLQKAQLIPFHETLWDALENQMTFEHEWLNLWIQGILKIGDELRQAQQAGTLSYPSRAQVNLKLGIPESRQLIWSILVSHVHMTNNRLGILNRDEAYLGYLIKKSLEALTEKEQQI